MNREWCCTGKAIAQIMFVFVFTLRQAQDANLVSLQSSSDAILLRDNIYDNMLASALDKVVTFADEVKFDTKFLILSKQEATFRDRIDQRISG